MNYQRNQAAIFVLGLASSAVFVAALVASILWLIRAGLGKPLTLIAINAAIFIGVAALVESFLLLARKFPSREADALPRSEQMRRLRKARHLLYGGLVVGLALGGVLQLAK